VIRARRSESSIFDRRINSVIVSARMIFLHHFGRTNRGLLTEASRRGRRLHRVRTEQRGGARQRLQPSSRRTAPNGRKKDDADDADKMEDAAE
jgi:hypothetical protein